MIDNKRDKVILFITVLSGPKYYTLSLIRMNLSYKCCLNEPVQFSLVNMKFKSLQKLESRTF